MLNKEQVEVIAEAMAKAAGATMHNTVFYNNGVVSTHLIFDNPNLSTDLGVVKILCGYFSVKDGCIQQRHRRVTITWGDHNGKGKVFTGPLADANRFAFGIPFLAAVLAAQNMPEQAAAVRDVAAELEIPDMVIEDIVAGVSGMADAYTTDRVVEYKGFSMGCKVPTKPCGLCDE